MIRFWANLKLAATIAAGLFATAFGVYWIGRKDQQAEDRLDDLEGYKADRKAIDEAETFRGSDPALADRFLRDRAKRRDL
jgi:hypothetical protein